MGDDQSGTAADRSPKHTHGDADQAPPCPLRPDPKPQASATEFTMEPPEHNLAHGLPYGSPYLAGFGLGLTLLFAFWILGTGLGASGGIARVAAWAEAQAVPQHVAAAEYFGEWFAPGSPHVLKYYLVFMALGTFVGGLISAVASRRLAPGVERGPRAGVTERLCLALCGGVLAGFASRLARGCTSGQALTGTALLFTGSAVFLVCLFIGAYATALLVRREWR